MRISEGAIAFMFESCRQFTITDYAWTSSKRHEHEPKMWDDLKDNFSGYEEEIKNILESAGRLGLNGKSNGAKGGSA